MIEENEVGVSLRPDEIGIKDLLIADNRDRKDREKRNERDNPHFFLMSERNFRGTLTLPHNGRIAREPAPAPEIDRESDQHAHSGRAEAVVPAVDFAERAGDEGAAITPPLIKR